MTNGVCALSRRFGIAGALTVALAVPATAQLELEAPHHRLTLSAADLAKLPRDTARITFRDSTFESPFRLLIVGDHRHSRWARQVVAIRVREESP